MLTRFQNKKIAVLGLGSNNRSLAAFLLKQGIPLVIREKNEAVRNAFTAEYADLAHRIEWDGLTGLLQDLEGFDIVFRSPSLPRLSPEFQRAEERGVEISSQTKLFFDLCPAPIIGVTGSKGKGTTSTLIERILKAGYTGGSVYLAGNIGLDPFSFYDVLTEDDLVILELSSFQLQDLHKSPQVAVLLETTSDHLDHHKTVQEYREAKQPLVSHQKAGDIAIINIHNPHMREYAHLTNGRTYLYDRFRPRRQSAWALREAGKETIFVQLGAELLSFDSTERKLLGEHNLDNILPAVIVGRLFDVDIARIAEAVNSFPGLEHRLSWVGSFNGGVDFYNDSIATTPESCLVAMKAFEGRRLHLIAGGNDKGGDYVALAQEIAHRCASVSFLPGTATDKLAKALRKPAAQTGCLIFDQAQDPLFPTILSGIHPHTKAGDVVLLSPAGSSFAAFADAKDRGRQFVAAVKDRYR